MPSCPSCSAPVVENARFCSSCGRPASSYEDVTIGTVTPPATPVSHRSQINDIGGFAPGAMLAGRYRIIALLGKGGMGEVYRADDLTLGQPVAIKFLPAALSHDVVLLDLLYAEVRNARQVSHPNVCRVYDIGEVSGRHFYTMEFIDGEDLSSLLRRIGRLSEDKGLEISHQICAGLAAAHESGLLHRDLKPANIMLDGRGRARITDFGLALPADVAAGKREIAGTPAYMAPEQLEGGQASVRSDIYSLGLVLYEIFTGKRPFDADSAADWRRAHVESHPKTPASVVAHIDPAIERAILRCLQKDPKLRPASAFQVAAALPGGDPLAAALAAGETPSPEMVAAAGADAGISPRNAVLLFALVILLLLAGIPLAHRGSLLGIAPMPKSPDALADRAQQYARDAGYNENVLDQYSWTDPASGYLNYKAQHEPSPERVRGLRNASPSPYVFHYRASPQPLATLGAQATISSDNPPLVTPGMLRMSLDGAGLLQSIYIVPASYDSGVAQAAPPDWAPLFRDAGLDVAKLTPAPPLSVPPFAFDSRVAWDGEHGGYKIHVDAASYKGKPVMFTVLFPWTMPSATPSAEQHRRQIAQTAFSILLILIIPSACVFFARRNMRLGRGHVDGASTVAVFVGGGFLASEFLWDYFPSSGSDVFQILLITLAGGLLFAGISWVAYVAVEPLVRRVTPHMLVSWTRLLAGKWTDPLVGRDVLLGVAAGILADWIGGLENVLPWWRNLPGESFGTPPRWVLGSTSEATAWVFSNLWQCVLISLLFVFLYVGGRTLLRNSWAPFLLLLLILNVQDATGSSHPLLTLAFNVPATAVAVATIAFLGPLAAAVAFFTGNVVYRLAGAGVGSWYGPRCTAYVLLILALAIFGLRNAIAGRSFFSAERKTSAASAT
ncbi:MAG: serine/threonine-protein kinase [Terriglobales bacterium]